MSKEVFDLPASYTAIELAQEQSNVVKAMLSLKAITKKLRQPKPKELLIRIDAAPINPSDVAFLQGSYQVKKTFPAVPGFEGSGEIVATGKALDSDKWLGKRVACFTQKDKDGTWAQYFLAKPEEVLLADHRLSPEQMATFFINPFTAWGLCEIALQRESKAIVVNAAGSRVAAFIFELARMHQIEVIGIVRKTSTAENLKTAGWKNILVESSSDFEQQLKTLTKNLQANTAFDAIGGAASGILLNALPSDAELVIYGGLSNASLNGIDPLGLIFENKMITGFNLNDWIAETDPVTFEVAKNTLTELLLAGDTNQHIQSVLPLVEIKSAMKTYLSNMSAGKVLLKP